MLQTELDGRAADNRESGSLSVALTGFADARSGAQVLDLLQEIASGHFGAMQALLLTRDPAPASGHRIERLTGGAASPAIEVQSAEVARRLAGGKPFVTDRPGADLPGVPLPAGAARAALVPCGCAEAAAAICAFWPAGADPLRPAEIERLRLLAAMAGLALDRQTADLRGRLMEAGIDNRIRNVLAVIRSVGTRSAERAASIEEFLLHFEGRIDAIGRSQIAAARTGEISFEHLLREELLAQTIQDDTNVSLDGMDVSITAGQAEALNLAVHELAVNAVKFGAFASPDGSLAVRWWVESAGSALVLNIDWRECLGPRVALGRPDRAGFGLTYLGHALPFQLNSVVTLNFTPRGLRCQIAVPLRDALPAGSRTAAGATGAASRRPLPVTRA